MAAIELLTFSPPLLLLVGAVALSVSVCGIRAGIVALAPATLLTDFFFVSPTLTFSLDRTVFTLALYYFLGGAASYVVARRAERRSGL